MSLWCDAIYGEDDGNGDDYGIVEKNDCDGDCGAVTQLQASISDMWHEGRKCPEWHISPRAPHSVKFWHILYSTAQSVKFVQGGDWRYHLPQN